MVLLPGCACCSGGSACDCVVAQCTDGIEVVSPSELSVSSLNVTCSSWTSTSCLSQVSLASSTLWPFGVPASGLTKFMPLSSQASSANNSVIDGLAASIVYNETWRNEFFSAWDTRVAFDVVTYCTVVPMISASLRVWVDSSSGGIVSTSLRLWYVASYAATAVCENPPGRGCFPRTNSTWQIVGPLSVSFGSGTTSLGAYQQLYRNSYGIFDTWIDSVAASASATFLITSRASCS